MDFLNQLYPVQMSDSTTTIATQAGCVVAARTCRVSIGWSREHTTSTVGIAIHTPACTNEQDMHVASKWFEDHLLRASSYTCAAHLFFVAHYLCNNMLVGEQRFHGIRYRVVRSMWCYE